MGGHEHRHPQLVDPQEELEDLPTDEGIQVAGRLVRDDQARIVNQGAGDGRPLLLAPGQLRRDLLRLCRQSDDRQDPVHGRADALAGMAGHFQRERDVLPDCLGGQELEILEDDPDLAAHPGHLATWQAGQVLGVQDDLPAGGHFIPDQQLDERRLAGSGRSHEEHEVALGDDQIHVAQGDLAVGILLHHVVQHQDRPIRHGLIAAAFQDATTKRPRDR